MYFHRNCIFVSDLFVCTLHNNLGITYREVTLFPPPLKNQQCSANLRRHRITGPTPYGLRDTTSFLRVSGSLSGWVSCVPATTLLTKFLVFGPVSFVSTKLFSVLSRFHRVLSYRLFFVFYFTVPFQVRIVSRVIFIYLIQYDYFRSFFLL